ncbi:hypothetical protein [Planktothrix sp. FACHB-1365]|uniref:hypothetical protein n=1 Tax=Planktothrix sp. FACHB-1365 TaxID=2692855 RepID=UPI0016833B14|nr:hypothetical protein [Planktothrix sp. FACHB-1365]MBD2481492.1 hypothetical protein [Planktothrix sp. FACHB-1365]
MAGQMCWLPRSASNGTTILHLRLEANKPWVPYYLMAHYSVPDYPIPGGSKGWATYQKLFKAGWKLEPTPQPAFQDQQIPKAA